MAGQVRLSAQQPLDLIAAGVPAEAAEYAHADIVYVVNSGAAGPGGIGVSATGTAGNAALITLAAPGVGSQYLIVNVDFSYTVTPATPGLLTITTDAGVTILHRGAVVQAGEGPVEKNLLAGDNKAVAIQLSGVAGSVSYINAVYKVVPA